MAGSKTIWSAAIVLSLALAAALWLRGNRFVALLALLFGLAFATLDAAEVVHQLDEHHTGIAVVAVALAAGHLMTAGLAGRVAAHPATSSELRP